jgi:hypothetical protein
MKGKMLRLVAVVAAGRSPAAAGADEMPTSSEAYVARSRVFDDSNRSRRIGVELVTVGDGRDFAHQIVIE